MSWVPIEITNTQFLYVISLRKEDKIKIWLSICASVNISVTDASECA